MLVNAVIQVASFFLNLLFGVKVVVPFAYLFFFSFPPSHSLNFSWSSGWINQPAPEIGRQTPNRSLVPG